MLLSTLLRPARRALLLRHLPPLHHQPSVTQSSSRFYHHRPPPKDGFIALSSVRGYLNEGREGAGRGAVGNFSSDDRAQLLKRAATRSRRLTAAEELFIVRAFEALDLNGDGYLQVNEEILDQFAAASWEQKLVGLLEQAGFGGKGVTWEMLGRFSLVRAVEMGDIQFERILPGGTAAQTLHACVSCSACSTT